jgi:hypothetical protein
MNRHTRALLFTLSAGFSVLHASCSSAESGEPGADAGDGKLHPPPNQVRIAEAAACQALLDGYEAHAQAIGGCILTSRICPDFLRVTFGAQCIQYDQGSVDGCVAYYQSKTTCEDLKPALDGCVITAYPGTAPAGCP